MPRCSLRSRGGSSPCSPCSPPRGGSARVRVAPVPAPNGAALDLRCAPQPLKSVGTKGVPPRRLWLPARVEQRAAREANQRELSALMRLLVAHRLAHRTGYWEKKGVARSRLLFRLPGDLTTVWRKQRHGGTSRTRELGSPLWLLSLACFEHLIAGLAEPFAGNAPIRTGQKPRIDDQQPEKDGAVLPL